MKYNVKILEHYGISRNNVNFNYMNEVNNDYEIGDIITVNFRTGPEYRVISKTENTLTLDQPWLKENILTKIMIKEGIQYIKLEHIVTK